MLHLLANDDVQVLKATHAPYELLFMSYTAILDGGFMRYACRKGSRRIITYLLEQLKKDHWCSLWTLGIFENGSEALLEFWLKTAPSIYLLDDLYVLTPNIVLHMYKMSQSKTFIKWLSKQDMDYLDYIYSSSFNPYRSFVEQRMSLLKAVETEDCLARAEAIITALQDELLEAHNTIENLKRPTKVPITARKVILTANNRY